MVLTTEEAKVCRERYLYNFKATCTYVVDGDTADLIIDAGFNLTTKRRIRLLGINTPERGVSGYQQAKDYLKWRTLNKKLIVETYEDDVFGRYLGILFIDGVNINQELLELGLAVMYVRR
jgi:micrococcal nuclease